MDAERIFSAVKTGRERTNGIYFLSDVRYLCPMHRLVARFMLILIFTSSLVDLHDMSKMAMLINHYREHVATGSTTLADFINLHYGDQAEQHDKEHGHRSLPFKSHESASTHHLSACLELNIQISAEEFPDVIKQESLYQSHFTPGFIRSIFQPPRHIS